MTDDGPTLRVERSCHVASIVIDRPPVNAVTPSMIEEFLAVIPEIARDGDIRCVILRGAGRFFIAGADIAIMRNLSRDNHLRMRRWIEVQRLLEQMPKPIIAALNGHALGGGAEIALACDLRIMAESATFGFPEMQLGLFPGAGGSQRLPRLVGPHRAKRIMIDAERLSAAQALELGLVDRLVPDDRFDEAVAEQARRWAEKPTSAIGSLKGVVDAGYGRPIDEALSLEFDALMTIIDTDDAAEGLQAFLDKRPPRFIGH